MHSEKRGKANKSYYYRSERTGDSVKKQYVGSTTEDTAKLEVRINRLKTHDNEQHYSMLEDEILASKRLDELLTRLEKIINHWKVLGELCNRIRVDGPSNYPPVEPTNTTEQTSDEQLGSTMADIDLPGPHAFGRLSKLADQGDPEAQEELDKLLERCPEMVREATDLTNLVKGLTIDFLGQGSSNNRQLLEARFTKESRDAQDAMQHHAMGRLIADSLLVSWYYVLICHIGTARDFKSPKLRKYWESAASRASKRLQKMQQLATAILRKPTDKKPANPESQRE